MLISPLLPVYIYVLGLIRDKNTNDRHFYSEMEFAFKFDFSKDFVKDFDASKYMVLQNFLKNAKEFTCVAIELTSINQIKQ